MILNFPFIKVIKVELIRGSKNIGWLKEWVNSGINLIQNGYGRIGREYFVIYHFFA
jgi:hypothetical protein